MNDSIFNSCYIKSTRRFALNDMANNILNKYIIIEDISFYIKQVFKFKLAVNQKKALVTDHLLLISYLLKNNTNGSILGLKSNNNKENITTILNLKKYLTCDFLKPSYLPTKLLAISLKYSVIKKKFYIDSTELTFFRKPFILTYKQYVSLADVLNYIFKIKKDGSGSSNCGGSCSRVSTNKNSTHTAYYSLNKNLGNTYIFSNKLFEFMYSFEKIVQIYFIKYTPSYNFIGYFGFVNNNLLINNNFYSINFNNLNSMLFITEVNSIKFGFFLDLILNFLIIILFLYLFFNFFNIYFESVFSFTLKIKNEIINNDSNLLDFKDSIFLSFTLFFNFILLYNYINSKFIIDIFFISFLYLNLMSLFSYFWLYDINIFIFIQGLFLKINITYSLFKDSLTLFAFCVRLLLQFVRLLFCLVIVFIFQNLVDHFNDVLKLIYYNNRCNSSISDLMFFLKVIIEFLDSIINFVIQMTNYLVFSL